MANYVYLNNYNNPYYGTDAVDVVFGYGGHDWLYGYQSNDWLFGGDGNDHLFGGTGDDVLYGENGNDTFWGDEGADIMNGGFGEDTVDYEYSSSWVYVNLDKGYGFGGAAEGDSYYRVEHANGSHFNDYLIGDGGANRLSGSFGSDRLEGGKGGDVLDGGAGFDTAIYSRSDAGVTIVLNSDIAQGGEAEGDTLISIENVTGSQHRDGLYGDGGANVLRGNGGDDTLYSFGGNDSVYGGTGDDTISGGSGENKLYGGSGDDFFYTGTGADHFDGGSGVDHVAYYGSQSGVWVDLRLGTGSLGSAAGDTFKNIENLTGSHHGDILLGNESDNRISGGRGQDYMTGHDGDDFLIDWQGNNMFHGGKGADHLQSVTDRGHSDGKSTFLYVDASDSNYTDGVDVVRFAKGDEFNFKQVDANPYAAGNQSLEWIGADGFSGVGQVRLAEVGVRDYLYVNLDTNVNTAEMVIEVQGDAVNDLDADYFLF